MASTNPAGGLSDPSGSYDLLRQFDVAVFFGKLAELGIHVAGRTVWRGPLATRPEALLGWSLASAPFQATFA
jgi:hypothetical protein